MMECGLLRALGGFAEIANSLTQLAEDESTDS